MSVLSVFKIQHKNHFVKKKIAQIALFCLELLKRLLYLKKTEDRNE